jgi:hypothetical protein
MSHNLFKPSFSNLEPNPSFSALQPQKTNQIQPYLEPNRNSLQKPIEGPFLQQVALFGIKSSAGMLWYISISG